MSADAALQDELTRVSDTVRTRPKLTRTGKILLGITGASFVGICAVTMPFVLPAARRVCLPYVPATTTQVRNVMSLLERRKPGRLVDLGSGDGRIVIDAARSGFQAVGVELNPWLVLYSRLRTISLPRTAGTAKFVIRDLWKHDLSPYDNVVIFGVDTMMPALHHKLAAEISADCRIIACRFPLPCEPSEAVGEGLDTVWLYTRADLDRYSPGISGSHAGNSSSDSVKSMDSESSSRTDL